MSKDQIQKKLKILKDNLISQLKIKITRTPCSDHSMICSQECLEIKPKLKSLRKLMMAIKSLKIEFRTLYQITSQIITQSCKSS